MFHIRHLRLIVHLLIVMTVFVTPAFAQVDLAGNWATRSHQDWQDRTPGPEVVDLTSLPVNDEARARALSYDAAQLSLPERQCRPYSTVYVTLGPQALRLWADYDNGNLVAWNISAAGDREPVKIWMDGRARPSDNAPHTFAGFTTGTWEGDVLKTYTTHMKPWLIRRNGVPHSDKAAVTMHLIRHGDLLTISTQVEDPIYLTRPYVLTRTWQMDERANIAPIPFQNCSPAPEVARLDGTGIVPHHLPGQNPFVDEMTQLHNIPRLATLGGAETAFPEFRNKIKAGYVVPDDCIRYCCGFGGGNARVTLPDCPTFGGGDFFNERPAAPASGRGAPQPGSASPAPARGAPRPGAPATGRGAPPPATPTPGGR